MIDEKKLIEDSGKLKVRYFDDDKRPYVTLYDFCKLIIDQPKISEYQEKVKKDMRSTDFTEEEQALIDGVEFGIDYQLEVAPEDIEEYHRLISSRCCKTG